MNTKPLDLLKDSNSNDYITLAEYADSNGISVFDLFKDITDGKYESAICLIKRTEECKTSTVNKKPIGYSKKLENYVTAKKFAKIHNLTYAGLLRGLKRGYYQTAFQEMDNKWYLDKNDGGWKSPLSQGYVSAKEYAEMNNLTYGTVLTDMQKGYYKTAFQDKGHHWFIKPSDKLDKTPKPDPDLEGYITMKEYAELNKVNYQVVSEDVRNGVYDSAIKRKGKFVYFPKNTPCRSNSVILETVGYLTIKEYADKNDLDAKKVKEDVIAGKYHTAKKVANVWYIRKYERPKTFAIPKDYILLSKYAETHSVTYKLILQDVKDGKYSTAQKFSRNWYIDKNEICVTLEQESGVEKTDNNLISLPQYAAMVGFSYAKIKTDVENGLYETAIKKKSRWYIDKTEPCKSVDSRKKKDYILLRSYAELHNVSYPKIQRDVKAGLYKTVKQIDGKWYIQSDEEFKSQDKRRLGTDLVSVKRYADEHELPYQKVMADVKKGLYVSAIQNGNRWYLDRKEKVKTTVRKYKRQLSE